MMHAKSLIFSEMSRTYAWKSYHLKQYPFFAKMAIHKHGCTLWSGVCVLCVCVCVWWSLCLPIKLKLLVEVMPITKQTKSLNLNQWCLSCPAPYSRPKRTPMLVHGGVGLVVCYIHSSLPRGPFHERFSIVNQIQWKIAFIVNSL